MSLWKFNPEEDSDDAIRWAFSEDSLSPLPSPSDEDRKKARMVLAILRPVVDAFFSLDVSRG